MTDKLINEGAMIERKAQPILEKKEAEEAKLGINTVYINCQHI